MIERPWESKADRERVQKNQASGRAVTGCFVWACVAFALVVVVVVVSLLDVWSGS